MKNKAMKIQDYLHLYLGCAVCIPSLEEDVDAWEDYTLLSVSQHGCTITNPRYGISVFKKEEVKPILRPLSDMTENEMEYCIETFGLHTTSMSAADWVIGWKAFQPECFRYLLSKQFDLFGLIDAGLAIDKTTVKTMI